jgi:DNA-binding IclR family transcriptional regulator
MAVKRSSSATRMLSVFELVARMQPIGVSALARELAADKSAVQRDLMTLADAGWIRAVPGSKGQWELTLHMLSLARPPHSSHSLRHRLRPLLERLHTDTGETVYLTLPHQNRFLVFDAIESRHVLRIVPPVGMTVPIEGSATAKAFLPYLDAAGQAALLGAPPSPALLDEFARTRARGYAVNDGEIVPGSVAIAAPLLDTAGRPVGTIVVVGPSERIVADRRPPIGALLRDAGRSGASLWLGDPFAAMAIEGGL